MAFEYKGYVDRRGYKREVFLKVLAKRLTGEDRYSVDEKSGNYFTNEKPVIYLGGGYWRCYESEDGMGYHLINPDRTNEEIEIVQKAMNIICL